jgi:predicted RNase H-like nuclease (RuvC/YqgF family)
MGTTELSPEVTERIARLERDNSSLTSKLDLQKQDHIEQLENGLDDAQRLAATFEVAHLPSQCAQRALERDERRWSFRVFRRSWPSQKRPWLQLESVWPH